MTEVNGVCFSRRSRSPGYGGRRYDNKRQSCSYSRSYSRSPRMLKFNC